MPGSKFCNCALPALRGLDVCKNCLNHKAWTSEEEYRQAMRDLEREIDLANDEQHLADLEKETLLTRPTWDKTFMEIAKVVAKRSKDPHTKVGAVLVKDGHILGIGYNGEPRDFKYDFDWKTSEKYEYVIHAELNAIANACSIGANVQGSDIYLTLSPCHECMKLLIQYQIRNVYYLTEYRDFEKSKMMSKFSKVKLIKMEE